MVLIIKAVILTNDVCDEADSEDKDLAKFTTPIVESTGQNCLLVPSLCCRILNHDRLLFLSFSTHQYSIFCKQHEAVATVSGHSSLSKPNPRQE